MRNRGEGGREECAKGRGISVAHMTSLCGTVTWHYSSLPSVVLLKRYTPLRTVTHLELVDDVLVVGEVRGEYQRHHRLAHLALIVARHLTE